MAAHQAPPSLGFSRQEHWSGLSFPFPEDSPNQGIKLASLTLQVDFLLSEPSISEERKLKIFTQVGSKIAMKQWLLSEKAIAPHSSTLAWKIPWMEEAGRLQSMRSLRVGHDWTTSLSIFTFQFHALEKEMATHSSVLAWRIPGTRETGGLLSLGLCRVGHDWSDLAAAAGKHNWTWYKQSKS